MFYGQTAIRYLKSLAIGRGDPLASIAFAHAQTWHDKSQIITHLKAGVAGLGRPDLDTAADEVGIDLQLAIRPLSAIGRFQGLRHEPPNIRLLTQTTGSTASFIQEGRAAPVSAGSYTAVVLRVRKIVANVVASNELIADGSPDAEEGLLADLLAACVEAQDLAFLDPANTGDDATPASITSSVMPVPATSDLDADLAQAVAQLVAQGSNLRSASWVFSQELGARMGAARGSGGALLWPGVGALGGVLMGLPVLTSGACAADSNGATIALIDAAQVGYADAPPRLRTSQSAMIEMDSTPTGDSITPASSSATLVSMFDADSTALQVLMPCVWTLRRPGAVQVVSGVVIAPNA